MLLLDCRGFADEVLLVVVLHERTAVHASAGTLWSLQRAWTPDPTKPSACAGAGCHIAPLRGSRGSVAEVLPMLLLHEAVAGRPPRPQQPPISGALLTAEESARAAYDRALTARNDGARVRAHVIRLRAGARTAMHRWARGEDGAPPAAGARLKKC